MGMLGVICEVSLKVLPVAAGHADAALRARRGRGAPAAQRMGRPAAAAERQRLVGRHAGAAPVGRRRGGAARRRRGSAARSSSRRWPPPSGPACATTRDEFFAGAAQGGGRRRQRCGGCRCRRPRRRWRCRGEQLVEWGGAQRWLCTSAPAAHAARRRGGRPAAMPRCSAAPTSAPACFAPLQPPLDRIHRELKTGLRPRRGLQPRPALCRGCDACDRRRQSRACATTTRGARPLRARLSQARAAGRPARDGGLAAPAASPAAACWRSPAAPAGGRRMARATPRDWLATDLNPETLAVARSQAAAGGACSFQPPSTPTRWPSCGDATLRRRLRRLLVEPRAAGAPARLAGHAARAAGPRRARW